MMDSFSVHVIYEVKEHPGKLWFDLMVDEEALTFMYAEPGEKKYRRSRSKKERQGFTWKEYLDQGLESGNFAVGIAPRDAQEKYFHGLGFFMIQYVQHHRWSKQPDGEANLFSAEKFTCDRTERHYADTRELKNAFGDHLYLALYAKSDFDRDPVGKVAREIAIQLDQSLSKMPTFDTTKERGEMLAGDLGLSFKTNESANENKFLTFIKDIDAIFRKNLNLSVLSEDSMAKYARHVSPGPVYQFGLQYGPSPNEISGSSLSNLDDTKDSNWKWAIKRATEEPQGWFSVEINPLDEFVAAWFQIRYKRVGHTFVPDRFDGMERTRMSPSERQQLINSLGLVDYQAQLALGTGKLPREKAALARAKQYQDILPNLPILDFSEKRGEILVHDLGIDEKRKFMKTYDQFISESQKVKTDPEVKEYSLKYIEGSQFEISSPNFNKTFSVEPYKKETVEKIRVVFHQLLEALDNTDVNELLLRITKAERIDYEYGKVFNEKFSLAKIPDLVNGLTEEDLSSLRTSERDFLLNQFSSLPRAKKDLVTRELRERGEILCCVIEALFFFLRKIDKENFYAGLAKEEILDLYETEIDRCSSKVGFTVKGPFQSVTSEAEIGENDSTAFWKVEYPSGVKFFIRATIAPKELYAEENISKTQGLKFSLITEKDLNPEKPFDFFNIGELRTKMGEFLKKLKEDARR